MATPTCACNCEQVCSCCGFTTDVSLPQLLSYDMHVCPVMRVTSCSVAIGLLLGLLLLVLVRPPAALRRHVVVATGLGNAGNLPLVLVAALIRETGGKLFGEEVREHSTAHATRKSRSQ